MTWACVHVLGWVRGCDSKHVPAAELDDADVFLGAGGAVAAFPLAVEEGAEARLTRQQEVGLELIYFDSMGSIKSVCVYTNTPRRSTNAQNPYTHTHAHAPPAAASAARAAGPASPPRGRSREAGWATPATPPRPPPCAAPPITMGGTPGCTRGGRRRRRPRRSAGRSPRTCACRCARAGGRPPPAPARRTGATPVVRGWWWWGRDRRSRCSWIGAFGGLGCCWCCCWSTWEYPCMIGTRSMPVSRPPPRRTGRRHLWPRAGCVMTEIGQHRFQSNRSRHHARDARAPLAARCRLASR